MKPGEWVPFFVLGWLAGLVVGTTGMYLLVEVLA